MADTVVVGADLGTSGLKLAALDEGGVVVAESEAAYVVDRPRPGWAQTEVAVWLRALDDAGAELGHRLAGRPVAALGLSGQMHGAVLVDAASSVIAERHACSSSSSGAMSASGRNRPPNRPK